MMSGDIVNLRQARKARTRREKDEKAAQNRSLFGRSKAEKSRDRIEAEKALVHIEGHRRAPSAGAPDGTGEED
jgi:hypothetical protein